MKIIYLFLTLLFTTASTEEGVDFYKILNKIISQCSKFEDVIKCFKVQGIKMVDNAAKSENIGITDSISIIQTESKEIGRSFSPFPKDHLLLNSLNSKTVDMLLWTKFNNFLNGHRLKFDLSTFLGEARGKKGRRYIWPLIIALGVKAVFMAMSYQGVAVMSGSALILGKIALLLSAILGLKKLVSSGEKSTTLEIVKHPQYSHSHYAAASYEDDGHYYHRNYDTDNEFDPHRRAYKAQINNTKR